jgi:PAT family beta-lactamase induction signal transducer AmpG
MTPAQDKPKHLSSEPPQRSTAGAFAVFAERRTLIMLALGFAAGLPNLLIFDTLSAWLRDSGLSLEIISFFSLATLTYSVKFLWAPLIDRTAIPGLTRIFGHRRSWMLVAQVGIILGLLAISCSNPQAHLGMVAIFAILTGFSSATQDIVIDAWRIEAADISRQGVMAAAYQWGYRIAIVIAGAVPLALADSYGWNLSYGLMAALMGIGIGAVLLAPRETAHAVRAIAMQGTKALPFLNAAEWAARLALIGAGAVLLGYGLSGKADSIWIQLASFVAGAAVVAISVWPIPGIRTRPGLYFSHALGDPLTDFFSRFGKTAFLILALICLYRLSDFVLNIMTPFYLDVGFTKTEIAEARKVFGVAMSMVGVFAGGWSVARLGIMRSLVIGAFALPITNMIFAWLAVQGPDMRALFIAIGIDNIVSGYAGTCLIAYMSSLTSVGFTATQYALFSSLYSLPGKLIASQSGRIVENAAHASEPGGPLDFLRALFAGGPPTAFADAMAKSHVSPAALGSGYVLFFFYSGLVGIASMTLAVLVARRAKFAVPPV